MNDDNGENLETPTASPAGTTTTEPTDGANPQSPPATDRPEEVEFNNLKGGTQDRIKQILTEKERAERELEFYKSQYTNTVTNRQTPPPAPSQLDPTNPQVMDAVAQLSKVGMATKEDVSQQINQGLGNLIFNFELDKLEDKFDGDNGLPRFDRNEYKDFVNRNQKYQNYDPEDVYNIMYSEELLDAKVKALGAKPRTPSSSLRPSKTTVREEQWTPEAIEARLKESDGKQWYSANKDLINKVLETQIPQE